MALAVFRSAVMSRITMGVSRKLKATCRKKPSDYNKFGDRDVSPGQFEGGDRDVSPGQFEGNMVGHNYKEWDTSDEEEFAYFYANEKFPDDMDEEERKETMLDMMYYDRVADDLPWGVGVSRPGGKFKYVSPGVYELIPRPIYGRGDIYSVEEEPPMLFYIVGMDAVSEDGCTVCRAPDHYIQSVINPPVD